MTPEVAQARIQQLGQQRFPLLILRELRKAAVTAEGVSKEKATTILKVRSGYLRRSIKGQAEGTSLTLSAGDDARIRYAAIHEYGGIIRPKSGKYLAIPVGPAKTPSGVSRFSSPRDVPGLTFAQSLRGQPMLVKASGKGKKTGAGTVYFLLRRQVKIRARPYMRPGMEAAIEFLKGRLPDSFVEVLDGQ